MGERNDADHEKPRQDPQGKMPNLYGSFATMLTIVLQVKYPYNLGLYRNICAVLGRQPILWLWPQRMNGDGLSFPTKQFDVNNDHDDDDDDDEESIVDDDDEKLYQGHDVDDHNNNNNHRSSVYTLQTMQSDEISDEAASTNTELKRQSMVSIPKRVHTRVSGATLRAEPSCPTTPASVMTFASSSTLVDPQQWKLPTKTSQETFEFSRRSR